MTQPSIRFASTRTYCEDPEGGGAYPVPSTKQSPAKWSVWESACQLLCVNEKCGTLWLTNRGRCETISCRCRSSPCLRQMMHKRVRSCHSESHLQHGDEHCQNRAGHGRKEDSTLHLERDRNRSQHLVWDLYAGKRKRLAPIGLRCDTRKRCKGQRTDRLVCNHLLTGCTAYLQQMLFKMLTWTLQSNMSTCRR